MQSLPWFSAIRSGPYTLPAMPRKTWSVASLCETARIRLRLQLPNVGHASVALLARAVDSEMQL